MERTDIRLAIPSNGRLETEALAFLQACGLPVDRRDSRQYMATVPALPGLTALWQRQNDIVRGVAQGSLDFAIVGLDALKEHSRPPFPEDDILVLHEALDIAHCELYLAIPLDWPEVETMVDLARKAAAIESEAQRPLRVATKFPHLTGRFLQAHAINHELIKADGTLEITPSIGYADMIADLVSTGTTLRANQLRQLTDGLILHSQGVLIANKQALRSRPEVLSIAHELLEFIEAYLRGQSCFTVIANVRGESPEAIAASMERHPHIRGLQGPTIAPVIPHDRTGRGTWFAVQIVVAKRALSQAIRELRAIGGSGVIVTPVKYIFEEEPERYLAMLKALEFLPHEPESGRNHANS